MVKNAFNYFKLHALLKIDLAKWIFFTAAHLKLQKLYNLTYFALAMGFNLALQILHLGDFRKFRI